MALEQGHAVEVRARILHVFGGVTRPLGGSERAGHTLRRLALDATSSAVTLSILVPEGTDLSVLAARLSRHPIAVEAQVGAPF
ncbi:hypothetical protein [Methylobacterium sp. SyP6R]|uniref:hypothetical protein n=1 Tax=Methylobacterium sp. SyP6R TaxID=2718876 RepID=UPI001F3CD089|nr:hypothetical protein [Methylobacterium sp. SyP6R]MCF4128896.1 hypothetical protein [Methylobacterium sp. SyP6R]